MGILSLLTVLQTPAVARDFQSFCQAALGQRSGAIVAVDVRTGKLLALVNPGFAKQAVPPGSVFKLVTALAGLEQGKAGPLTCNGRFKPPGEGAKPCWKPGGHGRLTLEEAIAQSCNVYFYQLGTQVGRGAWTKTATRTGLIQGLPATASLADASVGEGATMRVTALQMAGFMAAIATDGRPRTVGWTGAVSPDPIAPTAHLTRLRTGMRTGVALGSGRQAASPQLAIAGKTGTSTYTDGSNRTYGWFAGYAPADRPQMAVVVMLRDANGFHDAAPVGRRVFEAWMKAGQP